MSDDTTNLDRPSGACILCPVPREGGSWRLADRGYVTCEPCLSMIREALRDIVTRYSRLDPAPGATGDGGRGVPGFGSRSPGSDHIIAMTDRRSSVVARTWRGGDGRLYREPERPPLSVHNVLDTACWDIAEHRGVDGPDPRATVDELARWIDVNLDWTTRQELVVDVWQALRGLLGQLRPVTGDPARRHIGLCPNVIDEGEVTRECGARLYAPLRGDAIECGSCHRVWPRSEWLRLGDLLQDAS